MASISRRILFHSAKCPRPVAAQYSNPRLAVQWQRPLSSTSRRCADDGKPPEGTPSAEPKKLAKAAPEKLAKAPPKKRAEAAKEERAAAAPDGTPSAGPRKLAKAAPKKLAEAAQEERAEAAPDGTPGSAIELTSKSAPIPEGTSVPKNMRRQRIQASLPKLSPEDEQALQLAKLAQDLANLDPEAIEAAQTRGEMGRPWSKVVEPEDDGPTEPQGRPGFWAEGEEKLGPDEDYYGDDLTSLGHGELEQHRELREYARLAVWELPLLSHLAKPFELPTEKTPFRFRYTSYLGERHPAANKVVVEFSASDMKGLKPQQKDKLIKLAGPRYNPDTDVIKMSCELFDTLPQNKRFLGDTIQKLLAEARDSTDTFEDVPFDFRHHKPKVRYQFPKEWVLTPERKAYLENKRRTQAKLEDERTQNGLLIDGSRIIENSMPYTIPQPVALPAGKPARR